MHGGFANRRPSIPWHDDTIGNWEPLPSRQDLNHNLYQNAFIGSRNLYLVEAVAATFVMSEAPVKCHSAAKVTENTSSAVHITTDHV